MHAIFALFALVQTPGARLDSTEAARIMAVVRSVAADDGGRLWGRSLAGPVLVVDPSSGLAWANQADSAGGLTPIGGGLFRGRLPAEMSPANTAVRFGGALWTMVVWPLPADSSARRQLLAHELWHRIQDSLGLPMYSPVNGHLDREPGRIWLRLEARALSRALGADGDARVDALVDALSFRMARAGSDPAADSAESRLEGNEGLAEYTGLVLSGRSAVEQRGVAAAALGRMEQATTVARSFAYSTGPAYGLLLDALRPGWRLEVRTGTPLARLAARAVGVRYLTGEELARAEDRYEGASIRTEEGLRAAKRAARRRDLVARLVEGPVLILPLAKPDFAFNPNAVESLDSLGTAYGGLRLVDAWGVLDVAEGQARIGANFQEASVPVGDRFDRRKPAGPGWTLTLAKAWTVVPDAVNGRWRVTRNR